MGLLGRRKEFLAEQASQQAAEAEYARRAEIGRLESLARQAQAAADKNLVDVAEFLPLFQTLDVRTQLKDLVILWSMGRVDQVPKYYACDGGGIDYASLAWRKKYWVHGWTGSRHEEEEVYDLGQRDPTYRFHVQALSFEVQMTRPPKLSFKIRTKGKIGLGGWRTTGGDFREGWHEFSLNDPNSARTLLIETMIQSTIGLPKPREIIKKAFGPFGGIETPYCTAPETPIRHPFLLRLGVPDFDFPKR